jgi:hypothetical protein
MAMLQAARAYKLGLPLESAFSWGLNRAIFYAAAKRGFKGTGRARAGRRPARSEESSKIPDAYHLGDEMAFKDEKGGKPNFTIGGKVQTKEDFERQIGARFQNSFKEAWKEALDYVNHFESQTLLSVRQQILFGRLWAQERRVRAEVDGDEQGRNKARHQSTASED